MELFGNYMDFAKIVAETPYDARPHGVSCSFIRISKDKGIKLYPNHSERESTYNMQHEASLAGLAPKVFQKFGVKEKSGYNIYGYVTEAVEETLYDLFISWAKLHMTFHGVSSHWFLPEKLQKQPIYQYGASCYEGCVGGLKKELEVLFSEVRDMHSNNTGFLNGEVVCIDLGEFRW